MKTILVSAFSCTPFRGSEPGVGWNWPLAASKLGYRVIVVTRLKLKEKIERVLKDDNISNLEFVYCKSSAKLRKLSIYLEYLFWQRKVWKVIKRICASQEIDYLWFLTMGSMILPNYLYKIKNVPLIWGPVGGGENVLQNVYSEWPKKFRRFYKRKEKIISFSKKVYWVKKMQSRSNLIILRTSMSKRLVFDNYLNKTIVASETFLSNKDFEDLDKVYPKKEPNSFVFCFDGRLIASKNVLNLALAFKSACNTMPNSKLIIIGDGEQFTDIQSLSCERIIMMGVLDRKTTMSYVAGCDCFCFPSLREGTSWSLVEAMYLGRPVICTDANGVGDLSEDSGCFRIHINESTTNATMIDELAHLLKKVYFLKPKDREELGKLNKNRIIKCYSEDAAFTKIADWFK